MLSTLALRVAVVAALSPSWLAPDQRPTLAAGRVYDSRVAPLDAETIVGPVVVVSTPGTDAEAEGARDPHRADVRLVIETLIQCRDDSASPPMVGVPMTDRELERDLDVLDHQILMLLRGSPLVRAVAPGPLQRVSIRAERSAEGLTLAAHRIEIALVTTADTAGGEFDGGLGRTLSRLDAALPAEAVAERQLVAAIADYIRGRIGILPLREIMARVAVPVAGGDPVVRVERLAILEASPVETPLDPAESLANPDDPTTTLDDPYRRDQEPTP